MRSVSSRKPTVYLLNFIKLGEEKVKQEKKKKKKFLDYIKRYFFSFFQKNLVVQKNPRT